jgi:hypothetical protein
MLVVSGYDALPERLSAVPRDASPQSRVIKI